MPETVKCPANVLKNAQVKAWYMEHAGFIPGNYKLHPEVQSNFELPPVPLTRMQIAAKQVVEAYKQVDLALERLHAIEWEDTDWVSDTWKDRWLAGHSVETWYQGAKFIQGKILLDF